MGIAVRILFLLPDFVLPAESGLRVRALSQLRLLSSMEDVETITVLSLSSSRVPADRLRMLERQLPKVHAEVPVVRDSRIRRSSTALLHFLRRRLVHNEPYLIAVNNCSNMYDLIDRHLRAENYDIVYLGYLGMAAYLDDVRRLAPRARLILEQHNVEWQIFSRLATDLHGPIRHLARLEAWALKCFERKALRQVDSVIAISEADAAQFRNMAGVEPVVVPPYVEPREPRAEVTKEAHVGYIGHLAWQPNVIGIDWFCREVWPLVRQRIPDSRLTIAGPGLRKNAAGELEVPCAWQRPGISTVGFLDDLDQLYSTVVAMIAPVFGGSGVRMKLLETMSAGMPTVTTPDGAAGLHVADGREVLIARGADSFAEGLVSILSDADLRGRLRQGGYSFLASHHSESVAKSSLERALGTRS
jgi:glycosyltransferase involved in cell wall biosynthesis